MPTSMAQYIVISTVLMLAGSALPPAARAADSTAPPARPAPSSSNTAVAAGAVEDSLQACLARIPKDASLGQRLIAEQSCRRDDGDRQPVKATGGR